MQYFLEYPSEREFTALALLLPIVVLSRHEQVSHALYSQKAPTNGGDPWQKARENPEFPATLIVSCECRANNTRFTLRLGSGVHVHGICQVWLPLFQLVATGIKPSE
jgi:hypothetical protein